MGEANCSYRRMAVLFSSRKVSPGKDFDVLIICVKGRIADFKYKIIFATKTRNMLNHEFPKNFVTWCLCGEIALQQNRNKYSTFPKWIEIQVNQMHSHSSGSTPLMYSGH